MVRTKLKANSVGKWGEKVAHDYLVAQGYTVLATNWRSGPHEVDMIAMKDNFVAFIEVKTRTDADDDPLLAIDKKKISYLAKAAHMFMVEKGYPHFVRFDVISITGNKTEYSIDYIKEAFYPPMRTYR